MFECLVLSVCARLFSVSVCMSACLACVCVCVCVSACEPVTSGCSRPRNRNAYESDREDVCFMHVYGCILFFVIEVCFCLSSGSDAREQVIVIARVFVWLLCVCI